MADRVHPRDSPPSTQTAPLHANNNSNSESEKPGLPRPGTYVVQIPKDQVYRVPPPENASRYENYTRRKPRRSCCRCCLCWFLGIVTSLIILAAIAAGFFYLVVRPESPNYSVERIAFKGFNISTTSSTISPEIDVTVRAENPNRKIGIYYERESSVNVFYTDIQLCEGVLPAFYQPTKNVTELETALKGSGIKLTSAVRNGLVDAQSQGMVALKLHLKAPVRIKVGSIKTWTITVKVNCDLMVDKLTSQAKIVSKDCDYGVDPW